MINQMLKRIYLDNRVICAMLAAASMLIYISWGGAEFKGDESFHTMLIYLLDKGFLPVRDFYTYFVPNYIIFYDVLMKIFGMNIIGGRLVSNLTGAIIGVLVYALIWKTYRSKKTALLSWLTLQTSLLFLIEGSPTEAGAPVLIAVLFMMLALYLITTGCLEGRFRYFTVFALGFCTMFSVWSRQSTLISNAGLFLFGIVYLWRSALLNRRCKMKASVFAITGLILGGSFAIYLFLSRPDTFVFGYCGGHKLFYAWFDLGLDQTRRPFSFEPSALGGFIKSFNGQTALLLAFSALGILLVFIHSGYRRCRALTLMSVWIIISFFIMHFLFSSKGFTWHYMGALAPFFAIASAPFLSYSIEQFEKKKIAGALLLLSVLIYSFYGIKPIAGRFLKQDCRSFFLENKTVDPVKLRSNDLRKVKFLAAEISRILPKNGKLLSCTSAIYYEMGIIPPLPVGCMELLGDFSYAARGDETLNRHHLFTEKQIIDMIASQEFDVILVDSFFPGIMGGVKTKNRIGKEAVERYYKAVLDNYVLYKAYGDAGIYIKKRR